MDFSLTFFNNFLKNWANFNNLSDPTVPVGWEIMRVKQFDPGEYIYFSTFVVSLGARVAPPGEAVRINRLWANNELIYDHNSGFSKPGTSFTFFPGDENQGEVYRGMHYRGQMVILFHDFNLKDYRNSIPAITAELLDNTDTANVTHTILGAAASMGVQDYAALRTDKDTLYRAKVGTKPNQRNMRVTQVRLSTKAISGDVRLKDSGHYDYFSYYSGHEDQNYWIALAVQYMGLAVVPDLNLVYARSASHYTLRHNLYDMTSGDLVRAVELPDTYVTNANLAFTVNVDGILHYFIYGAKEHNAPPYTLCILAINNQNLTPFWHDTLPAGAVGFAIGKQANYATEIYHLTRTQLHKITVSTNGPGKPITVKRALLHTLASGTYTQLWYDSARDRVFAFVNTGGGEGAVRAYSPQGVVEWIGTTVPAPPLKQLKAVVADATGHLAQGTLVFARAGVNNRLTAVDLTSGESNTEVIDTLPQVTMNTPLIWDSGPSVLYTAGAPYIIFDVGDDTRHYNIAEVARAYARFVGYNDTDIVTQNLTGMDIGGYIVGGDTTLGNLYNVLGSLYGFNWTDRNGLLTLKSNYDTGGLVIDVTANADNLTFLQENSQDGSYFNVNRHNDNDFPSILSLSYFDRENDYTQGYQTASRNDNTLSDQRLDYSLPITLDGQYARELLYAVLYRAWALQLDYEVRFTPELMFADAGDAISFVVDGYEYHATINKHRINSDNSVSVSLTEAITNKYPTAIETQPTVKVPRSSALPVNVVMLDIPSVLYDPNEDTNGYVYALVAGYAPGQFRGAIIETANPMSPNDWTQIAFVPIEREAYIGSLSEEFDTWEYPFEEDTYNSLYVNAGSIPVEMFVPTDDAGLDDNANLIALGVGDDVELIQFKSVERIGPSTWRLYNLRRGRYGTEVKMRLRETGETVSFLNNATPIEYLYDDYKSGGKLLYRAYSPKQPPWQIDTHTHILAGHYRRNYAPVNVRVMRDIETDEIYISWDKHDRFVNQPPNSVLDEGPAPEAKIEYMLTLGANDVYLMRDVSTTENEYTYSIDDQLDDGLDLFDTEIPLAVWQINPVVGNGLGWPDGNAVERPMYRVYPHGALLGATFRLGGEVEADVSLDPPGQVRIAASYALGGLLRANVYTPARQYVEAEFDGGGSFGVNTNPTISVRPVYELGGAFVVGIREPVRLGADYALGGTFAVDIEVLEPVEPVILAAEFEGGGEMVARVGSATPASKIEVIEVVGAETNDLTTSITLGAPADLKQNDVLYAYIGTGDSAITPTLPTGWTLIVDNLVPQARARAYAAYKIVDGSEGSNFVFGWTNNTRAIGFLYQLRGVDTSNPIDKFTYK